MGKFLPVFVAWSSLVTGGCGEGGAPVGDASAPEGSSSGAPAVVDFDQIGLLVEASSFFEATRGRATAEIVEAGTADRALVTPEGVFAFLETPANAEKVGPIEPNTPVRLQGKLLTRGNLLHTESVEAVPSPGAVDARRFQSDPGPTVTLTGTNKCMCGIKVAEMHTSCELGHLHHLVAEDGKIYHYLQYALGRDALATMNYHFKPMRVVARELPGHFLLVESIEVTGKP